MVWPGLFSRQRKFQLYGSNSLSETFFLFAHGSRCSAEKHQKKATGASLRRSSHSVCLTQDICFNRSDSISSPSASAATGLGGGRSLRASRVFSFLLSPPQGDERKKKSSFEYSREAESMKGHRGGAAYHRFRASSRRGRGAQHTHTTELLNVMVFVPDTKWHRVMTVFLPPPTVQ